MFKHPIFRYFIAVLVAGAALYLAFHKQHLGQLTNELEGANLFIIFLGTGVMFLSHLVRAWRYKMFLRPIAPHTRLFSAFRALIAGYAANNIIPRAGDVVRPILFSKRENIPISSSVAVLLIERLTDLIGLSAILMCSVLLFNNEISIQFPSIGTMTYTIAGVLFVIFLLATLLVFNERYAAGIVHFIARIVPKKYRSGIIDAGHRTEEGLRGVRSGSAIPAIAGTLGISALYTCSMYISTFAFPSMELRHVGLIGCFLLQSMSGLAYILPAPGGTGTYHYLISASLATVFGVPPEAAIAFATLTHASNYLATSITGIAFMASDGISLTSARAEAPVVAQAKKSLTETGRPSVPFNQQPFHSKEASVVVL